MSPTATVSHFRVVDELIPPPGSSPGLASLITAAHTAIQTSVDLLGTGEPALAPNLLKDLKHDGLVDPKHVDPKEKSDMVEHYTTSKTEIDTLTSKMETKDNGVDSTIYFTGGIPEESWNKIKGIVDDLKIALAKPRATVPVKDEKGNVVGSKLAPSAEADVMHAVYVALGDVQTEIENANTRINKHADDVGSLNPDIPDAGYNAYASTPVNLVRHNSSGSYDQSYTAPVGFKRGSTTPMQLNDEQLTQHIREALKFLHIDDPVAQQRWIEGYLTLIKRESSGNANNINLTDSNAIAGHPSQGLTQTIPSTFQAYHVKGTPDVITDPTANIAASMNYVMHRYDVSRDGSNLASNVQQADPSRPAKGY